jgi:predicted component of viral defense system (DUF524 family)
MQNETIITHSLETMKAQIEKLSKPHHLEFLKILKKNPAVILNENKSGVYVNLSFLPKDTIEEMNKYLVYITEQENSLLAAETQKDQYKNSFFLEKEIKDNVLLSYNPTTA